jgi:hypothetical protein
VIQGILLDHDVGMGIAGFCPVGPVQLDPENISLMDYHAFSIDAAIQLQKHEVCEFLPVLSSSS